MDLGGAFLCCWLGLWVAGELEGIPFWTGAEGADPFHANVPSALSTALSLIKYTRPPQHRPLHLFPLHFKDRSARQHAAALTVTVCSCSVSSGPHRFVACLQLSQYTLFGARPSPSQPLCAFTHPLKGARSSRLRRLSGPRAGLGP